MTHTIKLRKDFMEPVLSGEKCFEVRENDRGYQKGDHVKFRIVDGNGNRDERKIPNKELKGVYTFKPWPIEDEEFEITYVLSGWGIQDGYVVFGIKKLARDVVTVTAV